MYVYYWLVERREKGELSLRLSGTPLRVPLWAAAAFWHFWLFEALEAFNQVVVAAALWALLLHLFEFLSFELFYRWLAAFRSAIDMRLSLVSKSSL